MSLGIIINGNLYTAAKSTSVFSSMENCSGSLNLSVSRTKFKAFPIKAGQSCQVVADGTPILTGFIETVSPSVDPGKHEINITARDKTADLIDSTLGRRKEFVPPVSMESVCKSVISDLGAKIGVINAAGSIEQFKKDELVSAEVGQTCFAFLESYARKRQILLTRDGSGNLVLARASTEKAPTNLFLLEDSRKNNILSSDSSTDITNRYYEYTVRSQQNPASDDFSGEPSEIPASSGKAYDKAIRTSRKLEIISNESIDSATAMQRATWEANIRRARSFSYSCSVQGHSFNGKVWKPNQLVNVEDFQQDVSATLLIVSVTYSESVEQGTTTQLTCSYPDAFTLQAEEDARRAKRTKTGDSFQDWGFS